LVTALLRAVTMQFFKLRHRHDGQQPDEQGRHADFKQGECLDASPARA
jgi:hypothetical protein